MRTLHLVRLSVHNFKGIVSYELNVEPSGAVISGTNGVGKTTLFDAYCWLLFGKDSAGRSDSAFDVKPYGSDGVTIEVSGDFVVIDGDGSARSLNLTRRLAEKTVRQRGTEETSVKNEYTFLINGVPKPKTQYSNYISELLPMEQIRLLSDPDSFAGKLKWEERRAILTDLFGTLNEADMLASDTRWAPIVSAAGSMSISDYRAVIIAERRKVKAELDSIPISIDEAQRAIPGDAVEPVDEQALAALEADIAALEEERAAIISGNAAAEANGRLAEIKNRIAQAKLDYSSRADDYGVGAELTARRDELQRVETDIQTVKRDISSHEIRMQQLEQNITSLRDEWLRINAQVWNRDAEVCSQCGQALPPGEVEQLRAKFNAKKSERLEANAASGKQCKKEIAEQSEKRAELGAWLEELTLKVDELNAEIDRLKMVQKVPPAFETTKEYKALHDELCRCQATLDRAVSEKEQELARVGLLLEGLRRKRRDLEAVQSTLAVIDRQKGRILELKEKGRSLGKRAAELDKLIELTAAFEQFKLTAIEHDINSRFEYACFKLFDRQLNGGYSECCEVVVDGAPYSTNLNPGKKIKAGLDIIRTLSAGWGFACPIWIDNAESYVELLDIGRQRIELRVDAEALALTVNQQ